MIHSNIKSLGKINQKILIFGGVYSNFQALESIYKKAVELNIPASHIICTGDIIGYCAEPEKCVQFIQEWGIHSIAGNVELNIRDEVDDCGCNFNEGSRCDILSKQWYPYALSNISKKTKAYIQSLPEFISFEIANKKAFILHGSYFNTSEFIFKSSPWVIKENNFIVTHSDLIIAGHCGLPFIHQNNEKTWFNPGVIGMPANDGTPRVWYGLIDAYLNHLSFQILPLEYDYTTAAKKMAEAALPFSYAQTLKTGVWDNCEILPNKEAMEQGDEINFKQTN